MALVVIATVKKLQNFDSHGAALAAELGPQQDDHLPLILGIFSIVSTLVNVGYINTEEVSWPPLSSQEFNAQSWQSILDEKVVKSYQVPASDQGFISLDCFRRCIV